VAATVAVAVGVGYVASNVGKKDVAGTAPALENPALANREPDAVASPAETYRFDPGLKSLAEGDTIGPPATAPVAATKPAAKPAPKPAVKPAPPEAKATPPRDLARSEANRNEASGKTADEPAQTVTPEAAGALSTDTADAQEEAATAAAERDAIRLQASRALSQLDRERRINRAAAATARLDQAEAERRTSAPTAPPPPPTLEQRAQVYLRIGLDEASRQLGGPVHVIEGMSPVFMGLAPGRVAAGADTTRPVVRVVYQDSQGRLITLDQQRRTGPGGTPPGGSAWSIGDVTVGLRGEVPAETLRLLRNRVR
jgi:hypothetical protein